MDHIRSLFSSSLGNILFYPINERAFQFNGFSSQIDSDTFPLRRCFAGFQYDNKGNADVPCGVVDKSSGSVDDKISNVKGLLMGDPIYSR